MARAWTVLSGAVEQSTELDMRFWLEHATADDRVRAVHACLVDSLGTKGRPVPRFRRVCRVLECTPREVPRHRRLRRRVPRAPPRDERRGPAHRAEPEQCEANARRRTRVPRLGPAGAQVEKLTSPRTVFVLGRAPVRIDILTSLEGLSFRDAWRRRESGPSRALVGSLVRMVCVRSRHSRRARSDVPALES